MQQVAPPLTGIHTPIKGGSSIFAFHKNNIQDNMVLPVLPVKRKPSGVLTVTAHLLAIFFAEDSNFFNEVFELWIALLLILAFMFDAK